MTILKKKYCVSKKRTEKWGKKRDDGQASGTLHHVIVREIDKKRIVKDCGIPYQGLSDQKEVGCGEQDNP